MEPHFEYKPEKAGKILKISIFIIAVGIGLVSVLRTLPSASRFTGSRICRPDIYQLDFSYMNQSDSHTIHLSTGESLKMTCEVRGGRIDITVGESGGDLIYRGNNVENAKFELPIQADGDYIISVDAKKASGKLKFTAKG